MNTTNKWVRSGLRSTRRWLLRSATLAFSCQMLVPPGFMPAALATGSPVVLCDGYLPPVFQAAMDHASATDLEPDHEMVSQTEHDEHSDSDAWKHCPLGALSSTAAPVLSQDFGLPIYRDDHVFFTATSLIGRTPNAGYRSRAPPTDFTRSLLI
jgi:ferredoxin